MAANAISVGIKSVLQRMASSPKKREINTRQHMLGDTDARY